MSDRKSLCRCNCVGTHAMSNSLRIPEDYAGHDNNHHQIIMTIMNINYHDNGGDNDCVDTCAMSNSQRIPEDYR